MSYVFRQAFPGVSYKSVSAKKRLLRMPIATFRVGEPASGKSRVLVFLIEALPADCSNVYQRIIGLRKAQAATPSMSKDHLKEVLSLAQNVRERECIKYVVYKSSGLSPTAARKFYGF